MDLSEKNRSVDICYQYDKKINYNYNFIIKKVMKEIFTEH